MTAHGLLRSQREARRRAHRQASSATPASRLEVRYGEQRRARGDDRRRGRRAPRRRVLLPGRRRARRGRSRGAARAAAGGACWTRSMRASATPAGSGSAPPAARASSPTRTERLKESELPDSIFDFTDAEVEGAGSASRRPTPRSRRSSARCASRSATPARARGSRTSRRNDPMLLENNIQTEEAIAVGRDRRRLRQPLLRLSSCAPSVPTSRWPTTSWATAIPGSLVNVAGAGILKSSGDRENARRFVEYLLSAAGQSTSPRRRSSTRWSRARAAPEGLRRDRRLQGPTDRARRARGKAALDARAASATSGFSA